MSVVKNSDVFLNCPDTHLDQITNCTSWVTEVGSVRLGFSIFVIIYQINGHSESTAKSTLGYIDTVYLFSYAFFIFIRFGFKPKIFTIFFSGWVAERVNLRYFLSIGMVFSGAIVFLFGFAYVLDIHSLWYLLAMQVRV